MNFIIARLLCAVGIAACAFVPVSRAAQDTRVYELRTYSTAPGKLDALLKRFRDHTTKLFEKHGMTNVGYFVPLDSADGAGEKLVYILSYPNRPAAVASWNAFRDDPEWKAVRDASEAAGKIVTSVESIFLEPTDFSLASVLPAAGAPRRFELRTYTTPEGGLGAIDARFRDHTRALFEKHGITSLYYWHPLDANKGAGHTLIYLIAHPSPEAAKTNWAAFRADPQWIEVKAASEKKTGASLTTEIKSVYLAPTDFSELK